MKDRKTNKNHPNIIENSKHPRYQQGQDLSKKRLKRNDQPDSEQPQSKSRATC